MERLGGVMDWFVYISLNSRLYRYRFLLALFASFVLCYGCSMCNFLPASQCCSRLTFTTRQVRWDASVTRAFLFIVDRPPPKQPRSFACLHLISHHFRTSRGTVAPPQPFAPVPNRIASKVGRWVTGCPRCRERITTSSTTVRSRPSRTIQTCLAYAAGMHRRTRTVLIATTVNGLDRLLLDSIVSHLKDPMELLMATSTRCQPPTSTLLVESVPSVVRPLVDPRKEPNSLTSTTTSSPTHGMCRSRSDRARLSRATNLRLSPRYILYTATARILTAFRSADSLLVATESFSHTWKLEASPSAFFTR
jgi:hypothetical protein